MSARGITIVSASAGSGKTTRLTRQVTDAVAPSSANPIALDGLFAVTYTRKAHAELAARIRRKLVEEQAFDLARELPLAYLGTVHAACLRLLQEFALDAGLSPHVDVVAGDQGKLLRESLDFALPAELRERLDRLAESVELHKSSKENRFDWTLPVDKIMNLARSNRIAADALPQMAARSADALLALFPHPEADGSAIDSNLERQIAIALQRVGEGDGVKKTTETIEELREAQRLMQDGELRWSGWVKLSILDPSKPTRALVAPVCEAAIRYEAHPRLHADIRDLTMAVYEAAASGLEGYQAWKTRQRVVDYVDMLDRALSLLEAPRVREVLGARLELAVVDEFQDTSPIQLALFVELHKLVGASAWVGDRKQCIFEYAGADPQLMDAVSAWVSSAGGHAERLVDNYRSRPELVAACSEVFSHALARHGFSAADVQVGAKRSGAPLAGLAPMGLFCLDVNKASEAAIAIASGVARMLSDSAATAVVDRTSGVVRPVRAGDIAVLVATNKEAEEIASALHARNVRASVARAGLLATPEGTLADSALRWLLDGTDSLAAATIDALTGFDGKLPEQWLRRVLENQRAAPEERVDPVGGWRAALVSVRDKAGALSPTEALDAAMDALDAVTLCARWPRGPERMANLEALRTLARTYEERCGEEREASTIAGLLRYFDAARRAMYVRSEMIASDDQHVTSDDESVTVCTYHKSKGLEWPVVVLASLDRGDRRNAFDVLPQSDAAEFDPAHPLSKRWIRYWPWPFGQQKSKIPLADKAARAPEGRDVAAREERERTRLLYVGFTRARDHLVLAVKVKRNKDDVMKPETAWLNELADHKDEPILSLPTGAADGTSGSVSVRRADGTTAVFATRVWRLKADVPPTEVGSRPEPVWFARPAERPSRLAYKIRPSASQADWPEVEDAVGQARIGRVERLEGAIELAGKAYDYEVLGTATHAFFAADVPGLGPEARVACAVRLLHAVAMRGYVRGDELVGASDALRAWADAHWPGARWHRELVVEAVVTSAHGERKVSGIVDLLLETDDGVVVVDHKTFPGVGEGAWRKKALEVAPQLAVYAKVLERSGAKVLGTWVHLPMGGGMVEVILPTRAC